jgi:predicted nucleic acid-binding protein
MRRSFIDTSGLVKLYRNEPNSPAVRACIAQVSSLAFHDHRAASAEPKQTEYEASRSSGRYRELNR